VEETDVNERYFYEIEAVKNDWSLSDLKAGNTEKALM